MLESEYCLRVDISVKEEKIASKDKEGYHVLVAQSIKKEEVNKKSKKKAAKDIVAMHITMSNS